MALISPDDGGYSVDEALLQWVFKNVPVGKTILELGAGESTKRFKEHGYKVISIEHDSNFINLVPGVQYIHAPIEDYNEKGNVYPPSLSKRIATQKGWYNREIVGHYLKNKSYDLILIDGPPKFVGRAGFLINIDLFDKTAIMLIDDLHRQDELYLARRIALALGKDLLITNNGSEIVGQKPNGDMKAQEKKPFGIIV